MAKWYVRDSSVIIMLVKVCICLFVNVCIAFLTPKGKINPTHDFI